MDQLLFNDPGRSLGGSALRYARVAVERGVEGVRADDALVYADPEGTLEPGDRVQVPLARSTSQGVVVGVGGAELLGELAPERIRPVAARVGSRVPADLIDLAQWMAEYYCCPLGMVLATMVPSSVKRAVGRRSRTVLERPDPIPTPEPKLPPATARAWDAIVGLDTEAFPIEPRALARHLGLGSVAPLNRLVERGLLIERREQYISTRVTPEAREIERAAAPARLTDEQRRTADEVAASLGGFSVHLLHGITGSGKTEVYLRAVRSAAEQGLSSIVLVPEIALTPQTVDRFTSRCVDLGVAVLHSGLSAGERHRQWALAAQGDAPVDRLGLIVVDEEHDGSYKQDQLPRYHARDVAIKRAHMLGVTVLLGSATPSLESYANATGPNARYQLHRLTRRVGGGVLPRVELVDMARQPRADAQGAPAIPSLSPRLRTAICETLRLEQQAILLLNRRGFSTRVACPDRGCGWTLTCHHCDASMVLHRSRDLPPGGVVRCHHCLAEQIVPRACRICHKRAIRLGIGTQRLEEELIDATGLDPERDLARVDSDSMRGVRDYFRVLDRFARRDLRVLVGTQMLAKGLDFPGVGLVGVIDADTSLAMASDFRSAERTFQLVSQVAGRAGRAGEGGLVIVQTMHPGADAIRLAASHDYDRFAQCELEIRRAAGLPPATRMARIISRDRDAARAERSSRAIADAVSNAADRTTLVVGPMPCAIARIADHFRFAVEIVAPSARSLQDLLGELRREGMVRADTHTAIDVDPVSLL